MLAYSEVGSGPAVILIHGLLGSRTNMSTVANNLAERFRVFSVDLRNHGDSFHDSSMAYLDMAEDVLAFMDKQNIKNASIVGHSLGGKVAMRLALSFPDRVNKIVVVDIAPKAYESDWKAYIKEMLMLNLDTLANRSDADKKLSKTIPLVVYRQFLLQNLKRKEDGTFYWRADLQAILNAENEICAAIDGPSFKSKTLFVKGGNSNYINDIDTKCILNLFPNAEIISIPDSGHLVHIDAREKFIYLLKKFLANSEGYT